MTTPEGAADGDRRTGQARRSEERSLAALVAGLAVEVRGMRTFLQREFATRPTRRENTFLRRRGIVILAVAILAGMQINDLHTEACGPGHRAEIVILDLRDAVINPEPGRDMGDVFVESVDRGAPTWVCGLTHPTHTHDGRSWPQRQHVAGLAGYAVLVALGIAWVRAPLRQRARDTETRSKRAGAKKWNSNTDEDPDDEGALGG